MAEVAERDPGDTTLREVEAGLDERRVFHMTIVRPPGGGWTAEIITATDDPNGARWLHAGRVGRVMRQKLWSDSITGILLAASRAGGA